MTVFHLADRPAWTCQVCGEAYPCVMRRAQLLEEFDDAPVQFYIFMSFDFIEAARELPDMPTGELHARFFGWYPHDKRPEWAARPGVWS